MLSHVMLIRRRLKLSQEANGTLRDWEQRRKEPDAGAKANLRVIALEPAMVRKALDARPRAPSPTKRA